MTVTNVITLIITMPYSDRILKKKCKRRYCRKRGSFRHSFWVAAGYSKKPSS